MKTIHLLAAAVGLTTLCGCAEFDQWVEADPYFASYDQGAYSQQQCVGYANTGPGGSDNGRPLASDGYSTWTGATQPCSQARPRYDTSTSAPGIR